VHRIFGVTAIFVGWLSLGIGAMAGLVVSDFFGLNHVEGPLPPIAVYGVSGAVVLWTLVAAAVVTAIPMAKAMVADDPRRSLGVWAVAMAVVGVAMIPDPLGRAFGLPLVGGAVCLLIGGELIHRETLVTGSATNVEEMPSPSIVSFPPGTAGPETAPAVPSVPQLQSRGAATENDGRTNSTPPDEFERLCPWCSTEVSATQSTCPNCGAVLDSPAADEVPIPGLTVVPPELRRYAEAARGKKRGMGLLGVIFGQDTIPTDRNALPPSEPAALEPPSRALKNEMARLDAEIAAGAFTSHADRAGDDPKPDAPVAPAPAAPAQAEPTPAEPAEPRRAARRRKPRG
jgi:hypothetical protein